jgi:hypothetical protein
VVANRQGISINAKSHEKVEVAKASQSRLFQLHLNIRTYDVSMLEILLGAGCGVQFE